MITHPKIEKVLLIHSNGSLIDYRFGYQHPLIVKYKKPLPYYKKYHVFADAKKYNWKSSGELISSSPKNTGNFVKLFSSMCK